MRRKGLEEDCSHPKKIVAIRRTPLVDKISAVACQKRERRLEAEAETRCEGAASRRPKLVKIYHVKKYIKD